MNNNVRYMKLHHIIWYDMKISMIFIARTGITNTTGVC